MLLPRIFRPIVAHPAPLSTSLTRIVLPVRTRYLSTTTIQSNDPITEPVSPPSSESDTPETQPETQPQEKVSLPYFVGRNSLNSLSVYHKNKRGGNLKLTLVKNGEGDLRALKQDIKEALRLSDGDVTLNSVTKHIIIRGHKKLQVLDFLEAMGF
ncbi:mitochondrial large subunit ribosomal protein-domain-containing protein [Annulohypoxylon truncatum]|uniref:mitochondrial large subunit ribosomal protein-domain-containing protein n=1 Tax=Annulohypoxylon truncatum TaxID=327061 RepID=UPI002007F051|nr:mitochondrial large subunit ribosomal protein-domain-containing protein [Annulohypoxylon truncatum]KAI1204706.1 mitochondrial large subunit ribosomal protein-domain-containing protein [Annulohypoxylon truncatum]